MKLRIGEETHYKKRKFAKANQNKGATPIEKNVIVVDEQGNEYEATYPKRAKGLVKNGRARFVDENKICLACPPGKSMEDKMKDNNQNVVDEAKAAAESAVEWTKTFEAEVEKLTQADPEKSTTADSGKYTIEYALEQLENVRKEASAFAVEMRQKIGEVKSNGPGDVGAAAAGEALNALVQEQEQIFRRMIDFYIGMISDLKKDASQKYSERQQFLDFVTACVGANNTDVLPDFDKIWNMINA